MSSEESNKTSQQNHLQDSLFDDILDKTEQFGNPFAETLWQNEKRKALRNAKIVPKQTKLE